MKCPCRKNKEELRSQGKKESAPRGTTRQPQVEEFHKVQKNPGGEGGNSVRKMRKDERNETESKRDQGRCMAGERVSTGEKGNNILYGETPRATTISLRVLCWGPSARATMAEKWSGQNSKATSVPEGERSSKMAGRGTRNWRRYWCQKSLWKKIGAGPGRGVLEERKRIQGEGTRGLTLDAEQERVNQRKRARGIMS